MARTARVLWLTLLLTSTALAGCVAGGRLEGASVAAAPAPGFGAMSLLDEGGFLLDVPVEVYLLGFDAATVDALRSALAEPLPIDHSASSSDRAFPPSPETTPLGGSTFRAPAQPRALFHLVDLDEATEAAFFDALRASPPEGAPEGVFDANLAEAWLAERIGALRGSPLERARPVFVILHGGDALRDHAWRYAFSHGHLDRVRIFGERLPVTVFDVSAQPDPFVVEPRRSPEALVFGSVFGFTQPKAYDRPLDASGEAAVDALVELATDAAHWRFLKGPLYPVSTKPCHHVTLLLAVHSTSLTETLPGFVKAEDAIDVEGLRSAFTNLTGGDVRVDLNVLRLPQEEPVLDALARGAGTLAGMDALRWYLDENFAKFVTPAEGCEEYLATLLWGDAAAFTLTGGMGVYDVQRGHRLAFAFVNEQRRFEDLYEGPGKEVVNTRNASRVVWNWATMLFAHEVGHIFGQQHPQHIQRTQDGMGTSHSFEAVYSVMGYQQDDRTIDFGAVDHATWTMGRAGYAIAEAQALGLVGTPSFDDALRHLAMGHWSAAHHALAAELAAAPRDDAENAWRIVGAHAHPGR
jgi:hypothetical protein